MTRRPLPMLLVALLLLSSLAPLASAGEAWEKQLGEEITAVATDERGDRIFVGTESGMLYCYDSAGSVVWSVQLAVVGADPSILDIKADTEGHVWVRRGNDYYLRNAETGASVRSDESLDFATTDGSISNTGTVLDIWFGILDLKIPTGTTIYRSYAPYQYGAISGDATWMAVTKAADTNLYLYSVNVPPDDWIAPTPHGGRSCGWQNRIAHTIAGSPDGALTNYPVEITVIRGAGSSAGSTLYAPDCHVDFADIRFTAADGVTQLPYYLESVVGSTATFLVNVPSIPASPGTTTIYIYWANPVVSTTTSDPDAARYTLDDFSGTSLNTDIWETFGTATITVADGKLTITGDNIGYSGVRSKGMYTGANDKIEVNANVEGQLGDNGAFWIGFFGDGQVPNSIKAELAVTLNRATFTSWNTLQQLHGSTADGSARANYLFGSRLTGYNNYRVEWDGTSAVMQAGAYAGQTLANAPTTNSTIMLAIGDTVAGYGGVTMTVDSVTIVSPVNIPALHGAWSAVESVVTLLDTETLTGTIVDIDAPETGDWVAVSTTSKTYIVQITDSGFGEIYNDDRVGTPYNVQVADGGSFAIEGRNILADIFRIDAVQVGTYTAGGAVQHVAIAQKNGLYAAAGSDDGKYYVFSKDAASSWYLLHASDSYDPVTALAMSWRGEIAVIGRADGSVVLYRITDAPLPDSQMTVYIIKDGQPYIGKPVSVSTADISDPDKWTPLYNNLRTDSDGKIVISTHTGHYYQININNGEKIVVIQASSATAIYSVVFRSPLIYEKYNYDVQYNASSQAIEMAYTDNEGPATVSWSIVRTDTYSEVYSHTTSGATTATATYPISEPDISYKVNVKIQRSSGGSIQNMWFITPQNASPIALPFWDENIQNAVFIIFLMILGGIFYYSTGAKGALIVALVAALFRYFDWITVPWFWIIAAAVFAFLANIAEGA